MLSAGVITHFSRVVSEGKKSAHAPFRNNAFISDALCIHLFLLLCEEKGSE